MSAPAYAAGTVLGDANSRRAAAFRALASGFLGMDGRRSSVRILLYSGFPNSAEWNRGSAPRTVSARASNRGQRPQLRLMRFRSEHRFGIGAGDFADGDPAYSADECAD